MVKYANIKKKDVKDLRILEVGCGKGGITFPLVSLGCKVRAFDIDETSVAYVRSQIVTNKIKNLTVTVESGYTFDDGNTYDIVIASEVFEHVLKPSMLAENITKRMNEGSYLIVTIPNGYGPWELVNRINPIQLFKKMNWLRGLFGKSLYIKGSGPDHCQFYTKNRLIKLFSDFSLEPIGLAASDSFCAIFSLVQLRSVTLENIDTKLADILPYCFASGWYFNFEMKKKDNDISLL